MGEYAYVNGDAEGCAVDQVADGYVVKSCGGDGEGEEGGEGWEGEMHGLGG